MKQIVAHEFTTLRGPILNPQSGGSVWFHGEGAIRWGADGRIVFVGDSKDLPAAEGTDRRSRGIIVPPFLDCHTHIPQWPIRGRFCEGILGRPAEGRLLAGLNRNVFPAEGKCADPIYTAGTVAAFYQDTLAHGVVGGAAYMTVHPAATATALRALPRLWSVGVVLMNMNCPTYLRTNEATLEADIAALAREFGRRVIVTDRFAVTADSTLRRRSADIAGQLGLRMQTHLNEQPREKEMVEKTLYPQAASYAEVYQSDGLLDRDAIVAHCVHMREEEFDLIARAEAAIAHCPVSNSLLGSGIMSLDMVKERNIPYAICTDVGASPTTSVLCEMAQFLKVHAGRSKYATGCEALYRATRAAAEILGVADQLGHFAVGRAASFIEVAAKDEWSAGHLTAEDVILGGLLEMRENDEELNTAMDVLAGGGLETGREMDWIAEDFRETARRLDRKVNCVTLDGEIAWERP